MSRRKHKRNKFNPIWLLIVLAAVLVGAVIYGGITGWFKLTISNVFNQPQAPLSPTTQFLTYNVEISLNPSTICVGDSTTGSIDSNIYNGLCTVYINTGEGYKFLMNANLDAQGKWSTTVPINSVGQAYFMAACTDGESNYRISNVVTLTSQMCADSNPPDGSGGQPPSGGGYTCYDSDGTDNYHVVGNCQDSYHQAGFQDYCSNSLVFDYYCDANNICQRHSQACVLPNICVGGICQLPPCGYVGIPSSAEVCWNEACPTYGQTCNYYAATLTQPARCECGYPID
jgi:hypothetical protein